MAAWPFAAVARNQHRTDLLGRVGGPAEMASVHPPGDLGPDPEAWDFGAGCTAPAASGRGAISRM
jgi:hypothetical protein